MIEDKDKGLIVQNYRLAKDKENQVSIEAELHGVGPEVIRGLLWEAGVYPIGPGNIREAALKIIENGVRFSDLRNYFKAFRDMDAKTARKIFKDYIYRPWGVANGRRVETLSDNAAGVEYTELAQKALDSSKERHFGNGHPKQDLVPAPAAAARPFTDTQAGLLVAALISLVTEKEFLRDQMKKDVDDLQANAKELLDLADAKLKDIAQVEKDIAEGRQLLDELKELKKQD